MFHNLIFFTIKVEPRLTKCLCYLEFKFYDLFLTNLYCIYLGQCKHTAAVFTFVNEEREESKTDSGCKWQAPSSRGRKLYPKGQTLDQILQNPKPTSSLTLAGPTEDDIREQIERFEHYGLTNSMLYKTLTAKLSETKIVELEGFQEWISEIFIIRESPYNYILPQTNQLNEAKLLLKPILSLLSPELSQFYESNVSLTSEECLKICKETVKQSSSPRWFQERKKRITASKAHTILRGRKPETRLKYFFTSPSDNANLIYGRDTEPAAKKRYQELTGNNVFDVGLIIRSDQSWVSASPDGLFKDDEGNICILEIKCPSSCKNSKINVDYIDRNNKLKMTHPYYTQVQMLLYVSGLKKCHFFVYSSSDEKLLTINFDPNFV